MEKNEERKRSEKKTNIFYWLCCVESVTSVAVFFIEHRVCMNMYIAIFILSSKDFYWT
jgi:hypothetical protein